MSDIEAKAGIVRRHITVALIPEAKLFLVYHKTGNNGVELCNDCFKKLQYLLEKTLVTDTIRTEKKE
jgi:hypothetical protein